MLRLSDNAPRCGLCRSTVPSAVHLHRLLGLDICDRCAVMEPSWSQIGQRYKTTAMRDKPTAEREEVLVEQRLAAAIRLTATFAAERRGHRFRKLVLRAREIQVGEPEFDDVVWIKTTTRNAAESFLAHPGVKDAVLELVRMGLVVAVSQRGVVLTVGNLHERRGQRLRAAAILTTHLVNWWEAQRPTVTQGPYR